MIHRARSLTVNEVFNQAPVVIQVFVHSCSHGRWPFRLPTQDGVQPSRNVIFEGDFSVVHPKALKGNAIRRWRVLCIREWQIKDVNLAEVESTLLYRIDIPFELLWLIHSPIDFVFDDDSKLSIVPVAFDGNVDVTGFNKNSAVINREVVAVRNRL